MGTKTIYTRGRGWKAKWIYTRVKREKKREEHHTECRNELLAEVLLLVVVVGMLTSREVSPWRSRAAKKAWTSPSSSTLTGRSGERDKGSALMASNGGEAGSVLMTVDGGAGEDEKEVSAKVSKWEGGQGEEEGGFTRLSRAMAKPWYSLSETNSSKLIALTKAHSNLSMVSSGKPDTISHYQKVLV